GQKFEQFTITDGDTAEAARMRIQQAAQGSLHVTTWPALQRQADQAGRAEVRAVHHHRWRHR
ncbi:hypothetical protein C7E17_27235, partial [Stenotrophomonas maltophilia]